MVDLGRYTRKVECFGGHIDLPLNANQLCGPQEQPKLSETLGKMNIPKAIVPQPVHGGGDARSSMRHWPGLWQVSSHSPVLGPLAGIWQHHG